MSSNVGKSDLPVFAAIWISFFLYGAIAAPVPAVNEPHYLCKARHFWQPDWCANDFFLQSSNAHTVFYATVGSVTQWFSLEQSAWTGRVLAILVLTAGWRSLVTTLAPGRWSALHVCWLFLALQSCGNFSGEWLVGGVEGKVFGYGFLLGALGQFHRNRMIMAGALAGLAVAIHPVIGVWGLLAFAGACAIESIRSMFFGQSSTASEATSKSMDGAPLTGGLLPPRSGGMRGVAGLAALAVCALPGLIPVFRLLTDPAPAQTKAAANFIQVYYRLAHHLDPMRFLRRAYYCYAALIVIWLVMMLLSRLSAPHRRFARIVGWSVLFAIAGIMIGWGPRPAQGMAWYAERAQLLKFYPFRLADVLVPLAVSVGVVGWLQSRGRTGSHVAPAIAPIGSGLNESAPDESAPDQGWRYRARGIGYGLLFVAALLRAHSVLEVNRYSGEARGDWIDACRWIDKHLPADALVHAPHNGWAFKWYAQRAEYVAFKDCPQDSVGIVEWNRRLNFLKHWFEDHYDDEFYSADELRDFRKQTGITHILTDRLGPLELDPIFENETFQVYDLTSLDAASAPTAGKPTE